jgi:hypothetical protein
MTNDELCNLLIGSCYIKQSIPGPIHVSSVSGIKVGHTKFLEASNDLVECGYLRQLGPIPEITDDLDSMLSTFELTPSGIENFEDFLKKQDPRIRPEKFDAATVVIQLPWFGGSATYRDRSNSEKTEVNITLKTALGDMIEQIDRSGAPDADKAEAKSKLKAFLEHPLVSAIAGAVLAPLLKSL